MALTHRNRRIGFAALMAEEQPVLAERTGRAAIEQKGAERRDAGAGPDHDDRRLSDPAAARSRGLLHIDLNLVAGLDAFGKEGRGKALAVCACPTT